MRGPAGQTAGHRGVRRAAGALAAACALVLAAGCGGSSGSSAGTTTDGAHAAASGAPGGASGHPKTHAKTRLTAPPRPTAEPLPADLRPGLAAAAKKLYGTTTVPSFAHRRTSLVSVGDSEISGEGVGSYTKGTDGPVDYCHRSAKSAIHRTGIAADTTVDLSCSGADSADVRPGGHAQYPDQAPQGDSLAVRARLTRVKMIAVTVGANDDPEFGAVMQKCITRRLTLKGPCSTAYAPGWQHRVDRAVPKVERALRGLRTVMHDAGYRDGDYRLVLMSYPSPVDGSGGCLVYPKDGRWAEKTAVPALSRGLRKAADAAGAEFLDASRLFDGHEACTKHPWVRGLTLNLAAGSHAAQGSYHPNAAGHREFGRCLHAFYDARLTHAACTAPGTGKAVLTAQD